MAVAFLANCSRRVVSSERLESDSFSVVAVAAHIASFISGDLSASASYVNNKAHSVVAYSLPFENLFDRVFLDRLLEAGQIREHIRGWKRSRQSLF